MRSIHLDLSPSPTHCYGIHSSTSTEMEQYGEHSCYFAISLEEQALCISNQSKCNFSNRGICIDEQKKDDAVVSPWSLTQGWSDKKIKDDATVW